jgi:hypothetical protein
VSLLRGCPFPIRLRVAPAATGPLIVAAVLAKALLARPCLDQRAVDREMLLRQQAARVGPAHDLGEKASTTSCASTRSRFLENVE